MPHPGQGQARPQATDQEIRWQGRRPVTPSYATGTLFNRESTSDRPPAAVWPPWQGLLSGFRAVCLASLCGAANRAAAGPLPTSRRKRTKAQADRPCRRCIGAPAAFPARQTLAFESALVSPEMNVRINLADGIETMLARERYVLWLAGSGADALIEFFFLYLIHFFKQLFFFLRNQVTDRFRK